MISEQSISEGYIQYDSIYIIFLKWQHYVSGEQICDWQGWAMVGVGDECDHKEVWREIFVMK